MQDHCLAVSPLVKMEKPRPRKRGHKAIGKKLLFSCRSSENVKCLKSQRSGKIMVANRKFTYRMKFTLRLAKDMEGGRIVEPKEYKRRLRTVKTNPLLLCWGTCTSYFSQLQNWNQS